MVLHSRWLGRWLFVVATWLVAHTATAGPLEDRIASITGEAQFKSAHWGLLIADLESGDVLYERDADKLFLPASTTKLFTTAAALQAFGADHRFQTPIYMTAPLAAGGRLTGNLVLVAGGDLNLGGRVDAHGRLAFRNIDHTYASFSAAASLTEQDPLAGLKELARQVAAAGVRHLAGEVVIDDRLFEPARGTGSGPSHLTPIVVNDNVVDLTIVPGEAGMPAQVVHRPQGSGLQVRAQVDSGAAESEPEVKLEWSGHVLTVRGSVPSGKKPALMISEVPDPATMARALLIDALRDAGVHVDAQSTDVNPRKHLPSRDAYTSLERVALLESPPLKESIRLVLKVSHNLQASTLPLLIAAKNGRRTLSEGMRLEHGLLKDLGVDVQAISFGGGAGGDDADLVTPRVTVQLLRAMSRRAEFPDYLEALPVLGIDGTLAEAVGPKSLARGKVQAKTGTLYSSDRLNGRPLLRSKALAGYATTSSGRRVAFAMFVNLVPIKDSTGTAEIGRTLGRLCEVLYNEL